MRKLSNECGLNMYVSELEAVSYPKVNETLNFFTNQIQWQEHFDVTFSIDIYITLFLFNLDF